MRNTFLILSVLSTLNLFGQKTGKSKITIASECSPTQYVCNLVSDNGNIGEPFSSKVFQGVVDNSVCLDGSVNGNYGCLGSSENQSWFILEVLSSGNLIFSISSSTGGDIDGAIWGILNNDFSNSCTILESNPISCDFFSSGAITLSINNAQSGQKYALLLANFSNSNLSISLNQPQGGSVSYREVKPSVTTGPLIACYTFKNSYRDSIGQTDGVAVGNLEFNEDRFGEINSALKVNGSSSLDINSSLLLNNNYTYSCWFKIDELPVFNTLSTLVSVGGPGVGGDQILALNNNYYIFSNENPVDPFFQSYFKPSVNPTVSSPDFQIKLGSWYHYAGVRGSDSLKLYVDGNLISKEPTELNATYGQSTATIGSRANNDYNFKGIVDDVLIFNRALSNDEVASLYNINNCQFVENPCSLAISINENLNIDTYRQASLFIESGIPNTISSSGIVEYSAGRSIGLNPGFVVESGGVFQTNIGGCR
ncbi:LamG domain-containing protein [Arcticibacterium luteifluviistationis]|uniref:LamG-like jellyroll fold domain-containing protein n=1 Tax=Arcticibacterium luteifluviistationis TaxID=1784714 RepID=A0A2Z4GGV5_9BACT|nr:LamG domain-containing protein [Arcticibacterium luteifluviistationis]AWW00623.1 hypothetical protein DJ013_21515 [Arcticibacterium luteifluviistationis]